MRVVNAIVDYHKQAVVAAITLIFVVLGPFPVWAIVVTNTNDSGPGSLRQAILDATGDGVPTSITFDPAILPATINVLSRLPELVDRGDTIDGAGGVTLNADGLTADNDHGLRIFASDISISGLTIQNFGGNGIVIQPDSSASGGASNQTLTGIVVTQNTVIKNLSGISLRGGDANNRFEVTITDNRLSQNESDGIVVNGSFNRSGGGGNEMDVTISLNDVSGSAGRRGTPGFRGDGIRVLGGLNENAGNNTIRALITNNHSHDNADEGIRIAGAGTEDSSSNNRIDAIIIGNTSHSNGTPDDRGSGITIAGGPSTLFPATTSGNEITFVISGNTITQNTLHGIDIAGNQGSNHRLSGIVSNNDINQNERLGLRLRGGTSSNTLENITIQSNQVQGNGRAGIFLTGEGSSNTLENITIQSNQVQSNDRRGIFLTGEGSSNTLENITIQFNAVKGNSNEGILVFGGRIQDTDHAAIINILLNGNEVSNNGGQGIRADLSSGVGNVINFARIANNVIKNNGDHGIRILSGIDGNGATPFSGNSSSLNVRDGINLNGTAGYVLTGNRARNNGRYGIRAGAGNTNGGGNISRNNDDPFCDRPEGGCFFDF